MKILYLLLLSSCFFALSCGKSKNDPAPTKTSNNSPTGGNNPVTTDSIERVFTAQYHLYDSSYSWSSNNPPFNSSYYDTTIDRTITVTMDSIARKIVAGNDTYKYNDTYKGYEGYYNGNPSNNSGISLTEDSVLISKVTNQFHMSSSILVRGYRIR